MLFNYYKSCIEQVRDVKACLELMKMLINIAKKLPSRRIPDDALKSIYNEFVGYYWKFNRDWEKALRGAESYAYSLLGFDKSKKSK